MKEHATIVERLRVLAEEASDDRGYTFLDRGEEVLERRSFGEVERSARANGERLLEATRRGERCLLLFPPGLDFITSFFACLTSGVVAVPAYPPDPMRLSRTLPRIQKIVADSRAEVVLTTGAILAIAEGLFPLAPDLARLRWIAIDPEARPASGGRAPWTPVPKDMAFLQYTSGSTASPRGVIISHANLVHNLRFIRSRAAVDESSVLLSWLPVYHDMGLINGVLLGPSAGCRTVLMSPFDFLTRPERWLRAISRERATMSGGPCFAYELCLRKTGAEARKTLDLSSWKVAYNGAEPIRAETLARFSAAFVHSGFEPRAHLPCYGLAEVTVCATSVAAGEGATALDVSSEALARGRFAPPRSGEAIRRLVSSGRAFDDDHHVRVVDPDSARPVPDGVVGEVWISSPSVGLGYWERPEETEATFRARMAGDAGLYLRTGDLAFYEGSNIYVTGRIKDVIIVGGQNHYPQDIELTAEESHPRVRSGCTAAFSVDDDGEEAVALVAEIDLRDIAGRPPADPREVLGAIRTAIARSHDLPVAAVVLIAAGTIPKTSSGKVQRRATKEAQESGALEIVAAYG